MSFYRRVNKLGFKKIVLNNFQTENVYFYNTNMPRPYYTHAIILSTLQVLRNRMLTIISRAKN